MSPRSAPALAAGLLGVLAGGCAIPRHAVVEGLVTPGDRILAAEVFPDRAVVKQYDPVEPQGLSIRRALEPTADGGLGVRSEEFSHRATSGEPGEVRLLRLDRGPDGSILLISSEEAGRLTTFDPPLVFMPAALAAGQTFEHSTSAVVRNARGRQVSSGRATRRVTYAGDQPADLVAQAAARVILAELELDLSPARVVTRTTFWVTDAGIVREQQRTDVRILGVPAESRRHDVVLRPQEPAP